MASSESVVGVEETKTKTQHIEKRKFYDRIAKYIVVSGGIAVILSILAILFFIGAEVVPLWLQPRYELVNKFDLSKSFNLSDKSESYKKSIVLVGTEEYKEIAFLVSNDGSLKFVNLKDGSELETLKLSVITEDNFITSSSVSIENKSFVVGTSDGYIQSFTVNYNIEFDQVGKRSIISKLLQSEPIKVADNKIVNVNFQENDDGVVATAVYTEKGEFLYYYVFEEEDFLGDVERQEINLDLTGSFNEEVVTDVQIDQSVENLYVSTNTGKLYHWKISDNSPHL